MTYVKLEDLEDASELLAALAHPIRLRIVAGLLDGGCCVGPMTECLQLPQPLVSRHLGILRDAGVVTVQPEGRNRRYEVVHPKAAALVAALLGDVEAPFVVAEAS